MLVVPAQDERGAEREAFVQDGENQRLRDIEVKQAPNDEGHHGEDQPAARFTLQKESEMILRRMIWRRSQRSTTSPSGAGGGWGADRGAFCG